MRGANRRTNEILHFYKRTCFFFLITLVRLFYREYSLLSRVSFNFKYSRILRILRELDDAKVDEKISVSQIFAETSATTRLQKVPKDKKGKPRRTRKFSFQTRDRAERGGG